MADAYTTRKRIIKIEVGASDGTWGTKDNDNSKDMLDEALGGYVSVSVTSGNVTLSTNNGSTDQARNPVITLTGTPGTTRTVTFPNIEDWHLIHNDSDSSVLLTAGAGTTVTVLSGHRAVVYSDGASNMDVIFTGRVVSGGQIAFPATQNPSADPNTLDDYEEGTFTPTLGDGTNNFTLSRATGLYTKNGNIVRIDADVIWTDIGSAGAGQLRISGLPFAGNADTIGAASFGLTSGLDVPSQVVGYVVGSVVLFARLNDNASFTVLNANASSATGRISLSAVYMV